LQTLTSLTELDSVNIMLSTIGESPINSLAQDQSTADVAIARQVLREITINVQQTGWHFNTEINWLLSPIVGTGEILLPANCVQVDSTGPDVQADVTMRGNRLYDRINHTFAFTKAISVDMVILLEFLELPQAARDFITIRAARVFQQRMVGSDTLEAFSAKDELRARAALKKLDSNTADYNILTGSWSVARSLTR
jgi:Tail tubular protein